MDFYENKIVELSEQARSLPGYENWLWSLPPEEKGREMETGADDIPMPQYPVWDAGLWINQSWIDIVLLFVWGASFFLIALVMFIRSNVL